MCDGKPVYQGHWKKNKFEDIEEAKGRKNEPIFGFRKNVKLVLKNMNDETAAHWAPRTGI